MKNSVNSDVFPLNAEKVLNSKINFKIVTKKGESSKKV